MAWVSDPTERVCILTRDLRPEEIQDKCTYKTPDVISKMKLQTLGMQFDETAFKEWKGEYKHRQFYYAGFNDGWDVRDHDGPELEYLDLIWGYKRGNAVVAITRNRPWGDGGPAWGTEFWIP